MLAIRRCLIESEFEKSCRIVIELLNRYCLIDQMVMAFLIIKLKSKEDIF